MKCTLGLNHEFECIFRLALQQGFLDNSLCIYFHISMKHVFAPGTRLEWSDYESMESSERLTEEMVVAAGGQHLQGELPSVLGRPLARSPLASGTARIATLPIVLPPAYIVLLMSLLDEISILDAAPVLIYYFSLVSMIISTCRILSKKWEFNQFQRYVFFLFF